MELLGKPVAEKIYQNLPKGVKPRLAIILIGNDPASILYIKMKRKIAEILGIKFDLFHLSDKVLQNEVEKLIMKLNQDKAITGIFIQLPLPSNLRREKILKLILSSKDVDGFYGNFPAPTAQAILEILEFYKIEIKNKKIVIIGRGRLVGRPLEKLLRQMGIRPELVDKKTKNFKNILFGSDIIVTATGVPGLIKAEMVSKNTIIIDAGTAEANGKIVGDVEPLVYLKVRSYSPVPGGVGPVTVACLMRNIVEAAKKSG